MTSTRVFGAAWHCTFALVLVLLPGLARADRDDGSKPMNFRSQSVHFDDLHKTYDYIGQVHMTQGTRLLTADKVTTKQDAAGFSKNVATGSVQKLAYIKQRENDGKGWMEGWGERIEYDDRTDKIVFYDQAHIKTSTDDAKGDVIIYDNVSERYQILRKGQPIPDLSRALPAQPGAAPQTPITRPSTAPSKVPLPSTTTGGNTNGTAPDGRVKAIITPQ